MANYNPADENMLFLQGTKGKTPASHHSPHTNHDKREQCWVSGRLDGLLTRERGCHVHYCCSLQSTLNKWTVNRWMGIKKGESRPGHHNGCVHWGLRMWQEGKSLLGVLDFQNKWIPGIFNNDIIRQRKKGFIGIPQHFNFKYTVFKSFVTFVNGNYAKQQLPLVTNSLQRPKSKMLLNSKHHSMVFIYELLLQVN